MAGLFNLLEKEAGVGLAAAAVGFVSGVLSVLCFYLLTDVPVASWGLFLGCSFGLLSIIVWYALVWLARVCVDELARRPAP